MYALLAGKTPASVGIRTPTGSIQVRLRNYESLKTVFSIFCRLDYLTPENEQHFIDIGSNIGVSALYFLSRNKNNTIECYEPDDQNLDYLRDNLSTFFQRARIHTLGVGTSSGEIAFFQSDDGKYSSIIKSDKALKPQRITLVAFKDVLSMPVNSSKPTTVKIDVEGIEVDLIKSVDFAIFKNVSRVICESLECADLISKPHNKVIRNGYVEDIAFV